VATLWQGMGFQERMLVYGSQREKKKHFILTAEIRQNGILTSKRFI